MNVEMSEQEFMALAILREQYQGAWALALQEASAVSRAMVVINASRSAPVVEEPEPQRDFAEEEADWAERHGLYKA